MPSEKPVALLPCRKCGAPGNLSHHYGIARTGWQVDCERDMETGDGSHSTTILPTEAEAVAAWNTRPPASEPVCPVCKGDPECQWGGVPANCHLWVKDYTAPPASEPVPEVAANYIAWCREQCASIMRLSGHVDEASQYAIASTASDIDNNLTMLAELLAGEHMKGEGE